MGGFFGSISTKPCVNDLFYGTDYHSHLGTKRAGLVTFDPEHGFNRTIHSLERDYFRSKFEDELDRFVGNQGLGVISDTDPQPIIVNSHLGRYAVVTVAKINNLREIAAELLEERMHLSELSANTINQTEVVALLINMGKDFIDGINLVYKKIKGSCSMLILTEDGIICARDYLGRTPIVIGKKEDGYAAASETSAFPNLGYTTIRDVGPGEIIRLRADSMEVLQAPGPRKQICSFLWVYYGFPASDYEGINVEDMREEAGRKMGEEDQTEADCVCGIPDSGVGHALGYAEGKGIPYRRAVLKYTPTWPRSFTPGNQSRRDLVAKMKLIPNRAILNGKRVVFCDDSIVRGTQLRDNVRMFYECGVKEVHARISCPPLVYGCPFIGFTSSKSDLELITRRIIRDFEGDDKAKLDLYATTGTPEYERMVKEIAKRLELSTLQFSKIEHLIESIGLPKCQLCTHCFDGTGCQPDEAWRQDHPEENA
ncbi:MAG: amidophosphoribosyltransferase [Duncaniella sp.]|uniref:amidophosphoribosyltransferase n=1 Tax=Duncaniella sp. TaxID=2518496 RepID=UPI0019C3DA38|nr:amidophosphoribosyltransferase [Duncaniella sp.]MBD5313297.1 amidophosphoribosyltransferase [Bacteroides sp.]MBD5334180.1 amidophosphoribosyltransferase [Bacteroides sp.]MDE6090487.1 amidophosphoribosyltransferase [Duncaniella sp.]